MLHTKKERLLSCCEQKPQWAITKIVFAIFVFGFFCDVSFFAQSAQSVCACERMCHRIKTMSVKSLGYGWIHRAMHVELQTKIMRFCDSSHVKLVQNVESFQVIRLFANENEILFDIGCSQTCAGQCMPLMVFFGCNFFLLYIHQRFYVL